VQVTGCSEQATQTINFAAMRDAMESMIQEALHLDRKGFTGRQYKLRTVVLCCCFARLDRSGWWFFSIASSFVGSLEATVRTLARRISVHLQKYIITQSLLSNKIHSVTAFTGHIEPSSRTGTRHF
jgi:hypothetical protein